MAVKQDDILLISFVDSINTKSTLYLSIKDFCAKQTIFWHQIPEEYETLNYISKSVESSLWAHHQVILCLFKFVPFSFDSLVNNYFFSIASWFDDIGMLKNKIVVPIIIVSEKPGFFEFNNIKLYKDLIEKLNMRYIDPIVIKNIDWNSDGTDSAHQDLKYAIAKAMVRKDME